MKKLIMAVVVMVALGVIVGFVKPAMAAKPAAQCAAIKDQTILDKFGALIPLGFNSWGYNYEAHMFNGKFCDAYGNADWCQQFKDVSLQMKWNDAWLSNKDCGTQGDDQLAFTGTAPDNKLDRHFPSSTYIDSGAWLTNHASGTYQSTAFTWNVTGTYAVNVEYLGVQYPEDLVLTQSGTGITGTSLSLVGGGSPWTIDTGAVAGANVDFYGYFVGNPAMRVHFTGTIASDGSMSGTWADEAPGVRNGVWTTTTGVATKEYTTCTVDDFVKIVAAPADAHMDGANWVSSNGTVIGPAIWGPFAVISEQGTDSCGEYGVLNIKSPLRSGLGNW
jgi:hypothetical protein